MHAAASNLSTPAAPAVRPSLDGARVLLVDDQPIIGEAVRRMLVDEAGIEFHYCQNPAEAIDKAAALGPTVMLLDLVMPEIDGLELVRRFRSDTRFRELPIIVLSTKEEPAVKAEAFTIGANDYIVKLPDRLELLARVRYHSRGYVALQERNEAFTALKASQQKLADDLATAAQYVRSLLPPPQALASANIDWRFIPSADLGGDAFGYHALDENCTAVYLLDVCGHGVGAALLSVSALNALRSGSLAQTDFYDPGSVLEALNRAFPMERQNDMFFTIWYGVFDASSRELRWAGGGHPAAVLIGEGLDSPQMLESDGPLIGVVDGLSYGSERVAVPPNARLFIYSDGAFEISRPDGTMWKFPEFLASLIAPENGPENRMDRLIDQIRQISGTSDMSDDFSMIQLAFQD